MNKGKCFEEAKIVKGGKGLKKGLEWLILHDEFERLFTNLGDGSQGDASELIRSANELQVGGYSDWRLPMSHEIGALSKTPLAPAHGWFWAPTEIPTRGKDCVTVSFERADANLVERRKDRSEPSNVRLVRSGQGTPITQGLFEKSEIFEDAEGRQWLILEPEADLGVTNWGDGRQGDASQLIAMANQLGACGYTDWRMPSHKELFSLDGTALAQKEGWFWSASTPTDIGFAPDDGQALFVAHTIQWDAIGTSAQGHGRNGYASVRLIRGQIRVIAVTRDYFEDARITAAGDLQWLVLKTEGNQKFTNFGDGRLGDTSELVAKANQERVGGYDDWRVPDIKELYSLIKAEIKPSKGMFWSSSPGHDESLSRGLSFSYGDLAMIPNADRFYVRLARSKSDRG